MSSRNTVFRCVALVLLFVALSITVSGQQPCLRWFEVKSAGSPGPRYGVAMAYDSDRGVTVMFGGNVGGADGFPTQADNETWEYDGVAWKHLAVAGPKPNQRIGHDMAYDPIRRQVVLFGGFVGGDHQDDETWTYQSDGTVGTWTRHYPLTNPWHPSSDTSGVTSPGFTGHKMAFDAGQGVVVLHGGSYFQPDGTICVDQYATSGEMWAWNGTNNWSEISNWPSLPASFNFRLGHGLVYDHMRRRLVTFGGILHCGSIGGEEDILVKGTYEFSNGTWSRFPGSTPALRWGHTMAYDSRRNKIVMLGGCCGNLADDTDEYTADVGWTSLLDGGLPPRYSHAMVYDSRRGVMVVYGGVPARTGIGSYDDTWELDVCTRPPEAVRWVDFVYRGPEESGTFTEPFNTLAEGVASVPIGGTLRIKAGTSVERPMLSKPMTIIAHGGPVTFGQ